VSATVAEQDLVSLALLGLHKSWYSFQDAMSDRENILGWERLWSDCVQEEIQRRMRDGREAPTEDKENLALVGKSKAKGKKGQREAKSSQKGKKEEEGSNQDQVFPLP